MDLYSEPTDISVFVVQAFGQFLKNFFTEFVMLYYIGWCYKHRALSIMLRYWKGAGFTAEVGSSFAMVSMKDLNKLNNDLV